jgi:autotransporter-associated beta strand protein
MKSILSKLMLLTFLAPLAVGTAQAATYTNTASGNWSDSTKWTGGSVPPTNGAADAIIRFSPTAALNSTNNLTGAFVLNQMALTAAFATTNTSAGGSSLTFTNSGATLPLITNSSTSTLSINSPVAMDTNLTVGVVTSGTIIIRSNLTETVAGLPLTKEGAGNLILNGTNTFSGGLTVNAGKVTFSSDGGTGGTGYPLGLAGSGITINGAFANIASGVTPLTIDGTRTITLGASGGGIYPGVSAASLTVNAKITGSGALNATPNANAARTLYLTNAANDFTGVINVQGVGLKFDSDGTGTANCLGAYPGSVTTNAITITSTGSANQGGILANTNTTISANRGITLNITGGGIALLGAITTKTLTINSALTTGGGTQSGIIKSGDFSFPTSWAGTLVLGGNNSIAAGVSFNAANGTTLRLAHVNALGTTNSAVTVNNNSVLDLNGTAVANTGLLTLSGTGISSSGALMNGSATAASFGGPITLGAASSVVAGSGDINLSNTGTISGSGFGLTLGGNYNGTLAGSIGTGTGTLTKQGNGTWSLSGTNTYTGSTTVSNGTLLVNGDSSAATGVVLVTTNATFGGTGSVGGAVHYQDGSLALFTVTPTAATAYSNTTYMTFTNSAFLTNVTVKVDMPTNLGNGTYVLATNYVSFTTNGTLTFATNSGSLGAGGSGSVNVDGQNLVLTVSGVTGGGASTNALLTSLALTPAVPLSPTFSSNVFLYSADYNSTNATTSVTVTNADLTASNQLIYNGTTNSLASGSPSSALALALGTNVVVVQVTAQDNVTVQTYTLNVTRLPSLTQPTLGMSVSLGQLNLTWPAEHLGYTLQVKTNPLNAGLIGGSWTTVPGSSSVTSTNFPISTTTPTTFYRLVYP